MADNRKYVQAQSFALSGSGVSAGATSITLKSFKQIDGTTNLTMTDFGTKGYGTLQPKTVKEEQISFTGVTQNANGTATLTGVSRVSNVSPYTETSGTAQGHNGNAEFVLSNTAAFYDSFVNKNNDETITGTHTYTSTAIPIYDANPTFTDDKHIISKKYADDLAIAGAPDMAAAVKGIGEKASDAELASGAADGSGDTTAPLVATATSFNETAAAGKVPVAESTAKIGQDWLGATTAGDIIQSDGTDLQRLAVTANQYLKGNAGGTAVEYGGANLDEANTFFGATDITGAEAETLTDGSNADSLHVHASKTGHIFSALLYSGTPTQGTTTYAMGFAGNNSATEDLSEVLITRSGTLRNLYVRTSAGNDLTTTITVRKNGAGTSLAVALSSGSTTGNDTSNTVSVSAGDRVTLQMAVASGVGSGHEDPKASFEFVPS